MKPEEKDKKLFLLDAYSLIFRGYYAFIKNPRINSKGLNTSVIMAFTNFLIYLITKENPTHIAVVFDVGTKSVRKNQYPQYKAHREKTPEVIRISIPYIQDILKAFYIPIFYVEGYEADDVIGTLAQKAEKNSYTTYIVTSDKDFVQLVTDRIKIYKLSSKGSPAEILGVQEVCQRYEVQTPRQVIDILGMMGDPVDNIPGLYGVGKKTAKKFIQKYGSLENLLAHSYEISGKLKDYIEENKELGLLSKKLATIITDVPIEWNEEKLLVKNPNKQKIQRIFEYLEFKRILDKFHLIFFESSLLKIPNTLPYTLPLKSSSVNQQIQLFDHVPQGGIKPITIHSGFSTLDTTDHLYQLVDTKTACKILLKELMKRKEVAFDIETTGLDALNAFLVGISFSYEKGTGYYVNFPENFDQSVSLIKIFRPFFEDERILKISHNIKYDFKVFYKYGFQPKGPFYDTMIAHYLFCPDSRHNIDSLSENFLQYKPISIESIIGKKGKNQLSMRVIELSLQAQYASEEADITFQLKEVFDSELFRYKVEKLFYEVEIPLIPVLAAMEIEGIRLDKQALNVLSKDLEECLTIISDKIYQSVGENFNINSPKQLGEILFKKLKIINRPKKTKTGQYATSEDILVKITHEHTVVNDILEYRSLYKIKSTYVDAILKKIDRKSSRIHTVFGQTITTTGRLNSTDPNLQNIPIRSIHGKQVRKAFIARDENYLILSADYSQIELRIIAELSKDPEMCKSFIRGEDIHISTASQVFNIPLKSITREQRNQAKIINFGVIYGVSSFGLSKQTGLHHSEAKKLIDAYYDTYPVLKSYISRQITQARNLGFVETMLGRRRYLPDINSTNSVVRRHAERNAINMPVQGSAADIIKLAMISIDKCFKENKLQSKMLLQVHDELVFDVSKQEINTVKQLIREKMQTVIKTKIPLLVEIGIGRNWMEAH